MKPNGNGHATKRTLDWNSRSWQIAIQLEHLENLPEASLTPAEKQHRANLEAERRTLKADSPAAEAA